LLAVLINSDKVRFFLILWGFELDLDLQLPYAVCKNLSKITVTRSRIGAKKLKVHCNLKDRKIVKEKTSINFTKKALMELPLPEKGDVAFCDTKEKGLSLRVTARGQELRGA
jgi:hypothetical protein